MLLPEFYGLPHPNFLRFHILASGLAHALVVVCSYSLELTSSNRSFLSFCYTFQKHLHTFPFQSEISGALEQTTTLVPQIQFLTVGTLEIDLLTYLLT